MKHRFFLSFLLVILMMPLSLFANTHNNVDEYYEKALMFFNAKKYPSAIISIKNALKINLKHLPSRLLLGEIHVKSTDGVSAEKELNIAKKMGADENLISIPLAKALNLQHKYDETIKLFANKNLPFYIQARLNFELGQAYLLTGKINEAEYVYDAILQNASNNSLGLQGKALVLLGRGDFFEAKRTALKAHQSSNDKAQTIYLLGKIENAQNNSKAANAYFSETLNIAPEHYNARLDRANNKIQNSFYDEAIPDLKILIKKAPYDAKPYYLLGIALAASGNSRGAKNAFLAAENAIADYSIEVKKKDIPTLLLAASIAIANNKPETAVDFYQIYLKQFPNNIAMSKVVAKLHIQNNNAYKAIQLLINLGVNNLQNPELYMLLGNAYKAEKRHQSSIHAYQSALKIIPNHPDILAKLGQSQVLNGDADQGFINLENALAQKPKSRKIGIFLAMQYFRNGKLRPALEVTGNLLKNNNKNLSILSLHASILASLGDLKQARSFFEKTLTINPDYRSSKLNLIKIDLRESNEKNARKTLNNLLSFAPKDTVLRYEQVKLEQATGNTDKALRLLEKLSAKLPKNLAINLHLVELYIRTRKIKDAVAIAEKLYQRNPNNTQVMEALGRTYIHNNDNRSARATFLRMTREVGYDANKLFNIALLQVRANDFDEARYSLSKAIDAKPDFYTAILTLAELEVQTERYDTVTDYIQRLKLLAPNNPNTLLLEGSLASKKGNYEDARSFYQQAHRVMNTENSMQLLFQSQLAMNEVDDALKVLYTWSETHPNDKHIKMTIADIHYQRGNHEQSIPFYENLVANNSANGVVYGRLAVFYSPKDRGKALEFARKAYKLSPKNEYIIDTYGWILIKDNKHQEALPLLREAISRNSSEPQIHYHLGVALERLGNKKQALKSYQSALSFNTHFEGIENVKIAVKNLN